MTEPLSVAATTETYAIERAEGTSFTLTVARAAGPEAPTLLVVPAMGMSAGYYDKLIVAFAEAGINAGRMEQRGHEEVGGRVAGWAYDFGYADLVDDIAAAVDRLGELIPASVGATYVLGHSLGGQAASAYAALHPDRVAGLVYVASQTPYWRNYGPGFLLASQAMGLVGRVVGHFPGKQLKFAGREARTLMKEWARYARTGRLRFGRPAHDVTPAMRALAKPALIVSIEDDWLAPSATVEEIHRRMPGLEVERVHLDEPGIDHFKWARKPDSTIAAVKEWLAR
ncbi:alpha/beta fold hydrolase [Nocardioides sp.]|uniref:alpha/beta hydrolase family protein n=1 Tax=Nocardioides sp. TaxID=35761 RepID=UPI0019BC828E|nr:alpha/beta fold hydrolase [Nocardioides sp.]MBC7278530.1 alpha/beta fold hydrolase [Nocardioides sp.]